MLPILPALAPRGDDTEFGALHVVIRYVGEPDALVRPPEDNRIDHRTTRQLRGEEGEADGDG
jgi:hypothetical protein